MNAMEELTMAIFSGLRPEWGDNFVIDHGAADGYIRLAQRGRKTFELESTIEYLGETGLEMLDLPKESMQTLRKLTPDDLDETDLASVPQPMLWWVNTYGVHTPAALIHDRFIGGDLPDGVTEQHIDRYFRFMLKDAGVRYIKRWIMWSAVALRTRFDSGGLKRLSVVVWAILAIAGIVGFIAAVWLSAWGVAFLLASIAPTLTSVLWGKQYGAGIVASYGAAPWVVPPLIVTVVFLVIYSLAELIVTQLVDAKDAGSEPVLWPRDEYHELDVA